MKIWVQIPRAQAWADEGGRMSGSCMPACLWVSSKLSETLSQKFLQQESNWTPEIQLWPPYMHIHMWTPHMSTNAHIHEWTHAHTNTCTYIKIHMYIYISGHINICTVHKHMYTCIHAPGTCMNTYTQCTHECINIHTWTHTCVMLYITIHNWTTPQSGFQMILNRKMGYYTVLQFPFNFKNILLRGLERWLSG